MVQFAAWTGVRAGELLALRVGGIGTETIRIGGRASATARKQAEERPGARDRLLPPARVLDDLRRPDPYVFHSPRGQDA